MSHPARVVLLFCASERIKDCSQVFCRGYHSLSEVFQPTAMLAPALDAPVRSLRISQAQSNGFKYCRYVLVSLVAFAFIVWLWRYATEGGSAEPPPLGLQPNVWLPYGASETIGARNYMEDRHVAASKLLGEQDTTLYAVFDGHGGSRAAEFCR